MLLCLDEIVSFIGYVSALLLQGTHLNQIQQNTQNLILYPLNNFNVQNQIWMILFQLSPFEFSPNYWNKVLENHFLLFRDLKSLIELIFQFLRPLENAIIGLFWNYVKCVIFKKKIKKSKCKLFDLYDTLPPIQAPFCWKINSRWLRYLKLAWTWKNGVLEAQIENQVLQQILGVEGRG